MKRFLLLLVPAFGVLFPVSSAAANEAAEAAFTLGNAALATDDPAAAVAAYEEALALTASANLHYNLGTAYARLEDYGRASLHLLKALALDPNHNDARANFALVRQQSDLGWTERPARERAATLLPLNSWIWLGVGFFWLTVFAWLFRRPDGSFLNALLRLGAVVGLLLALAALAVYHLSGERGVILEPVALRLAATDHSPRRSEVIPAGTLADRQKSLNGYTLIRTETGLEGYVTAEEFATVWEE